MHGTKTTEPEDLGLQVEDALIAELEADLPPEEVEEWRDAFLRERFD